MFLLLVKHGVYIVFICILTDDIWQTSDVFQRCLSVADFDDVSQLAGSTSAWCNNNRRLSRSCCHLVNDGLCTAVNPEQSDFSDNRWKPVRLDKEQFHGSIPHVAASHTCHMATVREENTNDCQVDHCQNLAPSGGCMTTARFANSSGFSSGNSHVLSGVRRLSRSATQLANGSHCHLHQSTVHCGQQSTYGSHQYLSRPSCHVESFHGNHWRMSKSCCCLADVAHTGLFSV